MSSKNRILRRLSLTFGVIGLCLTGFSQPLSAQREPEIISFSELKYTDVGTATRPGTQKIEKEGLEMVASGVDIWGKQDEFRFGYKTMKGNFDVSIQILNLEAANLYTKAGIMARVDLSDNCQHVYFQIFPDNSPRNNNKGGCEFQYRTVKGNEMKAIYPDPQTAGDQFNVAFPNTWIRLKRQGDVFESYFSRDHKTWKLYSSFTLKLPEELLVGPAVTSHHAPGFTTATFASFQTAE